MFTTNLFAAIILFSYFHIVASMDPLRPSFLILSFGTPKYVERWKSSLSMRKCYAAIYNYTFILETIHDTGAWANHHWIKPALILKYLTFYDYVFYLDLDIYIMNYKMPLNIFAEYLHGGHVIVSDEEKAPLLAGFFNLCKFEYHLDLIFLTLLFLFTRYDYDSQFYARSKLCQEMDQLRTGMGS